MFKNKQIVLSVLDQAPIRKGETITQVIEEAIILAQAAERLGFHRYWLSEHHNSKFLATLSPEVFLSHIGVKTVRIKLGAGGILLPYYSPLKVAENFNLLAALYPGRIDLGIGRGPGTDNELIKNALNDYQNNTEFSTKFANLVSFIRGDGINPLGDQAIQFCRSDHSAPELWVLGTSYSSAENAGRFQTAYSYAHFLNPANGPDIIRKYRQFFLDYQKLNPLQSTNSWVSIAIYTCTADEEELPKMIETMDYILLKGNQQPEIDGIPPIEEIKRINYTTEENKVIEANRQKMVIGSPDVVRETILKLADQYDADEVMLITMAPSLTLRIRSYELISQTFALTN